MSLEKLDLMLKEGSPGDLDSVLGIFSVIGLSRVASPPVRITTGSMFGVSSSEFGVRGSAVGGYCWGLDLESFKSKTGWQKPGS